VGVTGEIAKKLPQREYEYVVDATGSAEGLRQAVAMATPRGTVVMKSTVHGSVAIDTAPVIVNEITLVGSRCGPFEPALKMLASGKVRVDGMISEELPLSEAPKAFAKAANAAYSRFYCVTERRRPKCEHCSQVHVAHPQ
jgi:alcohol dehydrogenase